MRYLVPTKYGGSSVPLWEFAGWPVHLLGGSPQRQMHVWRHLACVAHIVSADGNYAAKMAVRWGQFWAPGYAKDRYWPRLSEADGGRWAKDVPYEAFRRSCEAIMAEWKRVCG